MDKEFLDIDGLGYFKDWLFKTFILKGDINNYLPKEEFEELKKEVEELKKEVEELKKEV